MKRFAIIFITLSIVFSIFTTPAEALVVPRKFKKCPQIKQDGITYILYGKCAIVARTPNRKRITIPNTIKHKGKKYLVRAIWDKTFELNNRLRYIDIKATQLECIEDPAIFDNHKIKVTVYDKGTYNWLKCYGSNVMYKR